MDYSDTLLAGILMIIVGKDIYSLWQKHKVSGNEIERNQINYLYLGLVGLGIFGIASIITHFGGKYPLAHIGNLAMACVLTYAVVSHRLLDIRIVLRRTLMWLGSGVIGIGVYVGLFILAHNMFSFDIGIAVLVYKLQGIFSVKVEQAFAGEKYNYRERLTKFIKEIYNIPTLEQFGRQFISLLAQSVGCHRAALLMPEAGDGSFEARFIYPPVKDNPMAGVKLRQDSPVMNWLKRKNTVLPERNLSIFPEFQSIWQDEKEDIRMAGVEIFAPLMNKGELVAVLVVSDKRDGKRYTVEDVDLLESIARRVAAGMEKEYSYESWWSRMKN